MSEVGISVSPSSICSKRRMLVDRWFHVSSQYVRQQDVVYHKRSKILLYFGDDASETIEGMMIWYEGKTRLPHDPQDGHMIWVYKLGSKVLT
ncbi:hypothetical protein VNO77_31319 [Canavalia gladiata]|uniref:Uncharacterized protein n=1 Tax=Canavalia gladiata TaxID=3824 RepID=A0AAN9Q3Y2_CANGL